MAAIQYGQYRIPPADEMVHFGVGQASAATAADAVDRGRVRFEQQLPALALSEHDLDASLFSAHAARSLHAAAG
jgi:hypothetical protein